MLKIMGVWAICLTICFTSMPGWCGTTVELSTDANITINGILFAYMTWTEKAMARGGSVAPGWNLFQRLREREHSYVSSQESR